MDLDRQPTGSIATHIEASSAVIDVLVRDRTAGGDNPVFVDTTWQRIASGPLSIEQANYDPGFLLFGIGTPESNVAFAGEYLTTSTPTTTSVSEPDVVKEDPAVQTFGVGDLVQLADFPAQQSFTMQAPFNVTFWRWSATAQTSDGPIELWSDEEEAALDPSGAPGLYANGAQQVFIRVLEGSMTVTVDAGMVSDFYVAGLELDVHGTVELIEARLVGDDVVQDLEGDGRFDLRIPRTTGDALEVAVRGQSSEFVPAQPGPPVTSDTVVSDPANENPTLLFWTVGLASALASVVAVLFVLMRGRKRESMMESLRIALNHGMYDAVVDGAPGLAKGKYRSEASLMWIVSSMHLHGTEATRRSLDEDRGLAKNLDEASKAFLYACICAHEQDQAGSEKHLERCLALDASYAEEAEANPFLATTLQILLGRQNPSDGYEFS